MALIFIKQIYCTKQKIKEWFNLLKLSQVLLLFQAQARFLYLQQFHSCSCISPYLVFQIRSTWDNSIHSKYKGLFNSTTISSSKLSLNISNPGMNEGAAFICILKCMEMKKGNLVGREIIRSLEIILNIHPIGLFTNSPNRLKPLITLLIIFLCWRKARTTFALSVANTCHERKWKLISGAGLAYVNCAPVLTESRQLR